MGHRSGKRIGAFVAALAALSACSSDADRQRDALAKEMAVAVAKVCPLPKPADSMEAGGVCTGDCRKANDARGLRYLLSAATELERLAPSPDATIEQQLAPVRAAAHAYAAEVGPACPVDVKARETVISEIEGCAAIAKTPAVEAREGALREALAAFLAVQPKGHGFTKASHCNAARR